jgi:branched-chain amino acid transport system substrate-binding protein
MRATRAASVAVAAILTATVGGCGDGSGSSEADDGGGVIKVAVLSPYTGDLAYFGSNLYGPIDQYLEQVNDDGGIEIGGETYTFEAVKGDTGEEPTDAIAAARQLITRDGVQYFSGPMSSSAASAVMPLMKDPKTLWILSSAVVSGPTENPNVFRDQALLDVFNDGMVNHLATLPEGVKVAVVTDQSHTGLVEKTGDLLEALDEIGADVVEETEFAGGESDFRSMVTSLKSDAPDVVLFRGYAAQGVQFRKQAQELGASWTEIWSTKISDADLLKLGSEELLSGLMACYDPDIEDLAKQGDEQAAKAVESFGDNFSVFADNAHDAAVLMVEGMKAADSVDPAEVARAIADFQLADYDDELLTPFLAWPDGRIFNGNEVNFEPMCSTWQDGGWAAVS